MIRRTHSIGDIIEFIRDPNLIKSDVSPYQETALRLLYGLPLSRKQQTIACKALDQDHILRRAYAEASPSSMGDDLARVSDWLPMWPSMRQLQEAMKLTWHQESVDSSP